MYKCAHLTHCVVSLKSKAQMLAFLNSRERSLSAQIKKILKTGLGRQHPEAEAVIVEMETVWALRREIQRSEC